MKQTSSLSAAGWAVLVITVAALVTGSCRQPADDGPTTLVVSNRQAETWARNFNPLSSRGDLLWPTRAGIYEPLLLFNVLAGEFMPWLAESYAWDETDQVVTFKLRPGVRWSDGEPFTADDVTFTFDLLRRYPAADRNRIWSYLDQVRAGSELEVSFVFRQTFVPGLEQLAAQPILPEHAWRSTEDPVATLNPDPVATGPFTEIVRFDESVYELGRNPYYWQPGKPAFDVLRVPAFPDNGTAVAALQAGTVDWSGNFIPDAESTFIAADPDHRSFWSPLTDGPVFLLTNTTTAPFDRIEVRKALSLAIDRERIVRQAMRGLTRPADGTFLDDAKDRVRSSEATQLDDWTHLDPSAAEGLLDDAGFPRDADGLRGSAPGQAWSFEILVPEGWNDWVEATEIISENLAAIGVKASPRELPLDQWTDRGQLGDFDMIIAMSEHRLTPYALYRSLVGSATVRPVGEPSVVNWHRFSDPDADALLMAFEMTSDEELQVELLHRIQLRVVEVAPAIPLFLGPSWGASNSLRFTGFPSAEDPYARLSPYSEPDCLLVLTSVHPRE